LCQLSGCECSTQGHIVASADGDNTERSSRTNCFTEGDITSTRGQGERFTSIGFNSDTGEGDVSSCCASGDRGQASTGEKNSAVRAAGVEQNIGANADLTTEAIQGITTSSCNRCSSQLGRAGIGGHRDRVGIAAIKTSKGGCTTRGVEQAIDSDGVTGLLGLNQDAAGITTSNGCVALASRDQVAVKNNVSFNSLELNVARGDSTVLS